MQLNVRRLDVLWVYNERSVSQLGIKIEPQGLKPKMRLTV